MKFSPRPAQREILEYTGGKLGVAAVPGSGKTRTLSALAARLVADRIREGEEVLVVTLVNAAVENFNAQIRSFLKERGLLANVGYRVRTLHSMCADIVRDNPGLVALGEGFVILDDRETSDILSDAVSAYLRADPAMVEQLIAADLEGHRREAVVRDDVPGLLTEIAGAFIQRAKDLTLMPEQVMENVTRFDQPLILAEMCANIYASYQRGLNYRGAVDFQDLIRLALRALEQDVTLLRRLRARWRYILEDEAQDSSRLQERILRLLSGDDGNWVRMGDPNQAIYETFTTANPELLWRFLDEPGVRAVDLPDSGRSAEPIIALANHLIDWTATGHPNAVVRSRRPLRPPYIRPTGANDPQPNPPADQARIVFVGQMFTPAQEIEYVAESLTRWLPDHPEETCAVLVPRNQRGYQLIDFINKNHLDLPTVEVLQSSTSTRQAAGVLGNVLNYLTKPDAPGWLSMVYRVWQRETRDDIDLNVRTLEIARILGKIVRVEDFLSPAPGGRDWLNEDPEAAALTEADPLAADELAAFRELVRRWQNAAVLPIDQLLLVLAGDLFRSEADLALAHSLAVVLRSYAGRQPDWRLPQFTDELASIARNQRRFLGMDDAARAFNPNEHRGRVAITTMHNAKGLEWDRVYLLSVNSYDFPSGLPGENYYNEKYYARDGLNLHAEALAQPAAPALPRPGIRADARLRGAAGPGRALPSTRAAASDRRPGRNAAHRTRRRRTGRVVRPLPEHRPGRIAATALRRAVADPPAGRPASGRQIRSAGGAARRGGCDRGLEDGAAAGDARGTGRTVADPPLPVCAGARGSASERRNADTAGADSHDLLVRRGARAAGGVCLRLRRPCPRREPAERPDCGTAGAAE
ncbi:MAG: UvrD-helicase domain-containing protein [Chloroflexi bacterium]|nr:UvrD-helicase domain-containing protein [Chloroflexota bacterium]